MRTIAFFFVWLAISSLSSVQGQSTDQDEKAVYAHALYRTDGSILKGEITEWHSDYLMFRLLNGLEIKIVSADVYKIISRKVPKPAFRNRTHEKREYLFREKGMYHVTTGAVSSGPNAALGVTHAVGYRASRLLSFGGGTGVETYDLGAGHQIVPLFAEVRGFLLPQNISPYYALRAGYGFALSNDETNLTDARGGRMWGFELGYRFGGTRSMNFFSGVGVHFQDATYIYNWGWEERFTDKVSHRRTELRIGVIF